MTSLDSKLLIAILEDWNSSDFGYVAFVSVTKIHKKFKKKKVLVRRVFEVPTGIGWCLC
jgi:hypothetical protein